MTLRVCECGANGMALFKHSAHTRLAIASTISRLVHWLSKRSLSGLC